jgi:predicted O-methyltransferase YrrM
MIDTVIELPPVYNSILEQSRQINFSMPSDLQTGSLLRTLVRSKPNGKFLELGTGTGLSLSWIVEGMDKHSQVISIDTEEKYLTIARHFFDADPRVTIIGMDGGSWIVQNKGAQLDLIFADAWPGKYNTLDETLALLKIGGFYIIDDMLPQPNWPEGHAEKAERLIQYLESLEYIALTKLSWSTGVIIVTRIK